MIRDMPAGDAQVQILDPVETEFKVVELTVVTDEEIEQALNLWSSHGWRFDGLHFAMWEGSKRPSMAYLTFVRRREPAT